MNARKIYTIVLLIVALCAQCLIAQGETTAAPAVPSRLAALTKAAGEGARSLRSRIPSAPSMPSIDFRSIISKYGVSPTDGVSFLILSAAVFYIVNKAYNKRIEAEVNFIFDKVKDYDSYGNFNQNSYLARNQTVQEQNGSDEIDEKAVARYIFKHLSKNDANFSSSANFKYGGAALFSVGFLNLLVKMITRIYYGNANILNLGLQRSVIYKAGALFSASGALYGLLRALDWRCAVSLTSSLRNDVNFKGVLEWYYNAKVAPDADQKLIENKCKQFLKNFLAEKYEKEIPSLLLKIPGMNYVFKVKGRTPSVSELNN